MLIKQTVLEQIKDGSVRLIFRNWKRPAVKTGSTLRTSIGVLKIDKAEQISRDQITEKQAIEAGFTSKEELLKELSKWDQGDLYRIRLRYQEEDPRLALRENNRLTQEEFEQIGEKLRAMDSSSKQGEWTLETLRRINRHPGLPAGELAKKAGVEKMWLKTQVRKLKEMGLTESLSPGYRLSPRGVAVLEYQNQTTQKKS